MPFATTECPMSDPGWCKSTASAYSFTATNCNGSELSDAGEQYPLDPGDSLFLHSLAIGWYAL